VFSSVVLAAGCDSANERPSTATALSVRIDSAEQVELVADPQIHASQDALGLKVTNGETTVFVLGARLLFQTAVEVPIGVGEDEIVLWAQNSESPSPVSATAGRLVIEEVPPGFSGQVRIAIVGARRPADLLFPSMSVDGLIEGTIAE